MSTPEEVVPFLSYGRAAAPARRESRAAGDPFIEILLGTSRSAHTTAVPL